MRTQNIQTPWECIWKFYAKHDKTPQQNSFRTFIHSLIHWFIHLFIHPSLISLIYSLMVVVLIWLFCFNFSCNGQEPFWKEGHKSKIWPRNIEKGGTCQKNFNITNQNLFKFSQAFNSFWNREKFQKPILCEL